MLPNDHYLVLCKAWDQLMIIWLPRICCERATSVNDDPYCKCWIEPFVRNDQHQGGNIA